MASLEKEIQQTKFSSEQLKANLNVLFTSNWIYNRISAYLRPTGLTHEQFNVLRILRGSHPKSMCQKDVLSRMISPSSNVTLLIKKLVAKKLVIVRQSPKDKREYMINITKQGQTLLKSIDADLQKEEVNLNKLSVSEAFHLNALLDKLRS